MAIRDRGSRDGSTLDVAGDDVGRTCMDAVVSPLRFITVVTPVTVSPSSSSSSSWMPSLLAMVSTTLPLALASALPVPLPVPLPLPTAPTPSIRPRSPLRKLRHRIVALTSRCTCRHRRRATSAPVVRSLHSDVHTDQEPDSRSVALWSSHEHIDAPHAQSSRSFVRSVSATGS
jgi:hypothetical protein